MILLIRAATDDTVNVFFVCSVIFDCVERTKKAEKT